MPAKPGFRGAERGRECRRNPSRLAVRKKLQDMKKKKKRAKMCRDTLLKGQLLQSKRVLENCTQHPQIP